MPVPVESCWRLESSFRMPSPGDAVLNRLSVHLVILAPCGQASRLPVDCDETGMPRIAGLLASGCPAAVVRRVIAIVVNAVDFVFAVGLRPKIGHEIGERIQPLLTNGYPATAVVRPADILGIAASGFHTGPASEFRRKGIRQSAFRSGYVSSTALDASARLAGNEIVSVDDLLSSAFAFAQPHMLAATFPSIGDDRPQVEHRALQVDETRVGRNRMNFSHDEPFLNNGDCGQGRRGVSAPCQPALF